jgi:hypothetical protein
MRAASKPWSSVIVSVDLSRTVSSSIMLTTR